MKHIFYGIFYILFLVLSVFGDVGERMAHHDSGAPVMPMTASAPMVSIPYFNDFESDIAGWATWARHDPLCIEFPLLGIYCSDIEWTWVSNPELIQVASDIFPDRVDLPEEVIDGLTTAYLPFAHSGSRAWWCGSWDGSFSNGTFIGDQYVTPGLSDDGGQSLSWMEATLTTPIFNTAGYSEILMSFWTWWEVECIDIYAFDLMMIEVSVDGGAWTVLDTLNPPFSRLPGWDEWESYSSGGYLNYGKWVLWTFDLSAYAGSDLQFRFHFDTKDDLYNGFRGWFIDDFYIGGGPEHGELEWNLNAITTMGIVDCRFSPNPFPADFAVWNSGGTTVHDVTATLQLPPGMHLSSGSLTVSMGDLAPAETSYCSWQILADDTLLGTRCFTILLTSADSLMGYRDNFDDSPPLFTDDGSGYFDYTDYSIITRAGPPISGTGFAGIPATPGTYPEAGNWYIESSVMSLAGFSECYIYFWQWLNVRESGIAMQGVDGGIVEINVNSTGWQQLDEFATGMLSPRYDGYIMNGISNPLSLKLAYCFDTGTWVQVQSHDLIAMGYCAPGDNLQVRFRFGAGNFSPDPTALEGWYIDDFMVSSTGHPVGPYEVTHCIWFPGIDPPNAMACCDTVLCPGEVASLITIVSGGSPPYSYSWFPTEGLSSPTAQSTEADPESTTTYFVEVRDISGCVDTDSVVVVVDKLTIFVFGDTTVCIGDTAIVGVVATNGIEPYTYSWSGLGDVISPTAGTTAVVPTSSGWVVCTVTDDIGCQDIDSIYIDVVPMPSEPTLLHPADGESLVVGTINLVWSHDVETEIYYVIVNGDTIASTSDTTFIFYDAICSEDYVWEVIAENGCGDTASGSYVFHIFPCEGPTASIVEPLPHAWSSCSGQNIVIEITDSDPIDVSSIRLTVNSTTFSVDGSILIFDGTVLRFVPPSPWYDGQTVSVCLDSVSDIYGNPMEIPLCWNFFIDLSPPHFWGEFPTGTVGVDVDFVGFHLEDTLSGLDTTSVVATVTIGSDIYSFGIEFVGDSFWLDVSAIDFHPGDTVAVCVIATDTTDYCDDNVLDTCWTFYIRPCELVAHACEDASICPGDFIELGAVPPYSGGISPYSVEWQTIDGTVIATTENPTVSPESTTTYVLIVVDSSGCFASDTVTIYSEFEPITAAELLYPPADTMLPPGGITLYWRALDGTPPIYYDVIIDDSIIASGITDTSYSIDVGCDETHTWGIIAYNSCSGYIPHCDSGGVVWVDSSYYEYEADTMINPWGWDGNPPFHTYPCDGPTAYIERPMPESWTSCDPESIIIRIEDDDGVVDTTILLRVNGVEYTTSSSEVSWAEPYLVFLPASGAFADGETVNVCLLSAEDIYYNTLTGDSLCWNFYIDTSPPFFCASVMPPPDTIIYSPTISVSLPLSDTYTGLDSTSLVVYLNGVPFYFGDSCLSYTSFWCGINSREVTIDSSCLSFDGCDTITIRVVITDTTDYCEDNLLDTSWSIYVDCEGPDAEAVNVPPEVWTSCVDESIVIHLWDSLPGVDTTTISLDITGYGVISFPSSGLTYDASAGMLIYYPSPPLPDWGAITVTLLSAEDMLGNPLEAPLSWTFFVDRIPPMALDWYPPCDTTISDWHPDISIVPYDSGCGIVLDSTVLTINDTLVYRYDAGDLEIVAGRFVFDPDDFSLIFPGGSEVSVCWHLVDCSDDICPPNVTDTCCTFYISSGGPFTQVVYPGDGNWVACSGDSILFLIADDDGIVAASVQFEICTGSDCSDCITYDLASPDVHGLTEFSDSLRFWFVPSSAFGDGDTVCVTIISAVDSLGNTLADGGYADSIRFYIDLSSPVMWGQTPAGELDEIPTTDILFSLFDSLSGVDGSSITAFVASENCTTDIMTVGSGIEPADTDNVYVLEDGCPCEPNETIWVYIHAADNPDTCGPNELDTFWFYVCPGCAIVADACDDSWLCPGHSLRLGAIPPASGGVPPYSYYWTTTDGDTFSSEQNPQVSPNTTTEYVLIAEDSYGCVAYDTVVVGVDFEPVTMGELLFPPADAMLPPGDITLYWRALDGTPPIYYDVIIDGSTAASGITDTFFTLAVECGDTHTWMISAYNFCTSQIAHCDSSGSWIEEVDTVYYADSIFAPWSGDPIFYIYPCEGPVASVVRPAENSWSSCAQESIVIRIDDSDGVIDTTILLSVNGLIFTTDSAQVTWNTPYLIFYPFVGVAPVETVHICLLDAQDIYGNSLTGDSLCWSFMTDFVPPMFSLLLPDSSALVQDRQQDVFIDISDIGSGVEQDSIHFLINGVEHTSDAVIQWNGNALELHFFPENIGMEYASNETIYIKILACDRPDYCTPNCAEVEWFFWTAPDVGCNVRPNPFTPNDDGYNDFTVFQYPQMFFDDATLSIYDLRGIEVYKNKITSIDSYEQLSHHSWNGVDNNGKLLSPGLYIYVITVDGEIVCNGTVVITR